MKRLCFCFSHLNEEQFGFCFHDLVVKVRENHRQFHRFPISPEHEAFLAVRRQHGEETVLHRALAFCNTNTHHQTITHTYYPLNTHLRVSQCVCADRCVTGICSGKRLFKLQPVKLQLREHSVLLVSEKHILLHFNFSKLH